MKCKKIRYLLSRVGSMVTEQDGIFYNSIMWKKWNKM